MRILSTNIYPVKSNFKNEKYSTSIHKENNAQTIRTKNHTPSFKASIYTKIVENQTLLEKFMTAVGIAVASATAYAFKNAQNDSEEIPVITLPPNLIKEIATSVLNANSKESSDNQSVVKEENADNTDTKEEPVINQHTVSELATEKKEETTKTIETERETEVPDVTIIESQQSETSNDKPKTETQEKNLSDNKEFLEHTPQFVVVEAPKRINIESEQEATDEDIYRPEGQLPTLSIKILGECDLTKYKKSSRTVATPPEKNPEVQPKETVEKAKEKKVQNEPQKTFRYIAPGTLDDKPAENLQNMMTFFKKSLHPKATKSHKVLWIQHERLDNVTAENIITEIDRVTKKSTKNANESLPEIPLYRNLDAINAYEIANIINSDERFSQLFTLHGALRLIDRFVNFKDSKGKKLSKDKIEKQTKKVLDNLIELLNNSFKKGVDLETIQDRSYRNGSKYGVQIIIKSNNNSCALGTLPIIVRFCENLKYEGRRHQCLIATAFTE